jgi:quercetin dioxygenase-like cupin family protein
MNPAHQPLPVGLAPDLVERDFEPLLREPFAQAWADDAHGPQAKAEGQRSRLLDRIAASRAQAVVMFTARRSRLPGVELAPGVQARTLYAAASDHGLRPGEPLRVRLIELAAGSRWTGPDPDRQCAWLVLQGSVELGDERLQLRDFHLSPAGGAGPALRTQEGAVLLLREAATAEGASPAPLTVRDEDAGWPDYAPGIQRRVLWQHAGQAAMLYYAQPGARVPLHTHGHDEECLMVQGELFLDDVLLRPGDYQLAPAGTGHRITETDTGVVIFAHGDLDLKFVA